MLATIFGCRFALFQQQFGGSAAIRMNFSSRFPYYPRGQDGQRQQRSEEGEEARQNWADRRRTPFGRGEQWRSEGPRRGWQQQQGEQQEMTDGSRSQRMDEFGGGHRQRGEKQRFELTRGGIKLVEGGRSAPTQQFRPVQEAQQQQNGGGEDRPYGRRSSRTEWPRDEFNDNGQRNNFHRFASSNFDHGPRRQAAQEQQNEENWSERRPFRRDERWRENPNRKFANSNNNREWRQQNFDHGPRRQEVQATQEQQREENWAERRPFRRDERWRENPNRKWQQEQFDNGRFQQFASNNNNREWQQNFDQGPRHQAVQSTQQQQSEEDWTERRPFRRDGRWEENPNRRQWQQDRPSLPRAVQATHHLQSDEAEAQQPANWSDRRMNRPPWHDQKQHNNNRSPQRRQFLDGTNDEDAEDDEKPGEWAERKPEPKPLYAQNEKGSLMEVLERIERQRARGGESQMSMSNQTVNKTNEKESEEHSGGRKNREKEEEDELAFLEHLDAAESTNQALLVGTEDPEVGQVISTHEELDEMLLEKTKEQ